MENVAIFRLEGILFLLRWMHVFAGIIWIGLLYYFNYVQGAFMAETDAPAKSQVTQKLLPRALWWFRWGAFWTMATGLLIIGLRLHQGLTLASAWGTIIVSGVVMGLIMGCNVWFIIWPKQKIVIANAVQTAGGGSANPEAAKAAPVALLASRTNTLLSIPMLFFMTGARNMPLQADENSNYLVYWILFAIIVGAIEGNALRGKLGPITTIKGVITCGFVLTAVLYAAMEILI